MFRAGLERQVVTFIFAMLMPVATTWAGLDCANPQHFDNPNCSGGGSGSITYTAELTTGAFLFNVVVTPNSKQNVLRSNTDLDMVRPGGVQEVPCGAQDTAAACQTWNQVFNTCMLFELDSVEDFFVGDDNWRIDKAGGVRVIVSNILLQGAEVTVQLIGNEFDFADSFLPEPGNTSTFILDQGAISGRSVQGEGGPRRACQPPGGGGFDIFTLLTPSILKITAQEMP